MAAAKERGDVQLTWPPAPAGSTLAVTNLSGALEGDRQKVRLVTFQILPPSLRTLSMGSYCDKPKGSVPSAV